MPNASAIGTASAISTTVALDLTADGSRVLAISPSGDSMALLTEVRETLRTPIDFLAGSAAFSPDGRRLAVVGVAGEVGLLDPTSGRWVR